MNSFSTSLVHWFMLVFVSFRYESIVPGNQDLVVKYKSKLYCMETEDKLDRFMR